VLSVALLISSASWGQSVPKLDAIMYDDPRCEIPETITRFQSASKPPWIVALNHSEADLKQEAAFTIAWARERGMADLDDTIEPLTKNLTSDKRLVVRLASARALVVLDARQSAESLFQQSQKDGLEMAQIVQPALARWDYQLIRDVWRKRLERVKTDRKRSLLAIRGLAEVKDESAADALKSIALDATAPPEIRIAAGESLGRIRNAGLEDAARELAARTSHASVIDRLVAAKCLDGHSSAPAQSLLIELAQDDEPSVAAIALNRLLEIDSESILPLAESALARGDVNVRSAVAKALIAHPSATSMAMLGDLMGDLNPTLRAFVTESLVALAESPDLHPLVIEQGERMLQSELWQALEQSLLLLTRLDHKAKSERFLELLAHQRPEVYVTAAWGLRRLAIDQTLNSLHEFVKKRNGDLDAAAERFGAGVYEQLAQAFQFYGQARYAPAEPLLRTFVPKNSGDFEMRSAAIWSLGYLLEGKPDAKLVKALEGRIRDTDSMEPEDDRVRRMAAVAIGRMKARDAVPTLESFYVPERIGDEVGYACAWSVEQITGRPFEKPKAGVGYHTHFFLEPFRKN